MISKNLGKELLGYFKADKTPDFARDYLNIRNIDPQLGQNYFDIWTQRLREYFEKKSDEDPNNTITSEQAMAIYEGIALLVQTAQECRKSQNVVSLDDLKD
jgi:hypothetical protein